MAEMEGKLMRCACCKSERKTLLKRDGKYVCRDGVKYMRRDAND